MKIKNFLKLRVKAPLKDICWSLYGGAFKNPALPEDPRAFLFVCKGNICRSPFAEKVSGGLAEKNGINGASFSSAGLQVRSPLPSPAEAVAAANLVGVDLNGHLSKLITVDMVRAHDMVIVMEAMQLKAARERFPTLREKFFLLPLLENGSTQRGFLRFNIPDPYGRPQEVFRECFSRIERSIDGFFKGLKRRR